MSISSSDNAEGIGTVKKTEIGAEGMHTYLTLPYLSFRYWSQKRAFSQQYDESITQQVN